VQNVFAGVKTIFRFGANNRKIAADPTAWITYKAKRDPKKRRLPFTFDEAKLILTSARNAGPEIFFPNLIAALSGAGLAEVVEAHTDDIEMIDGRWCLHIREDNRDENQTVKTESSVRTVPLHEEIIRQGFTEYVHSLPRGPLFPQYRTNKYNRRNDHASKVNSEFVRNLGIKDRRKAPMHSWRHFAKTYFKNDPLVKEEIHDAITGDGSDSEGRRMEFTSCEPWRSHRTPAESVAARPSARHRVTAAQLAGGVGGILRQPPKRPEFLRVF